MAGQRSWTDKWLETSKTNKNLETIAIQPRANRDAGNSLLHFTYKEFLNIRKNGKKI